MLDRLAFYLDSDSEPWYLDKSWQDLLPPEWVQVVKSLAYICNWLCVFGIFVIYNVSVAVDASGF